MAVELQDRVIARAGPEWEGRPVFYSADENKTEGLCGSQYSWKDKYYFLRAKGEGQGPAV